MTLRRHRGTACARPGQELTGPGSGSGLASARGWAQARHGIIGQAGPLALERDSDIPKFKFRSSKFLPSLSRDRSTRPAGSDRPTRSGLGRDSDSVTQASRRDSVMRRRRIKALRPGAAGRARGSGDRPACPWTPSQADRGSGRPGAAPAAWVSVAIQKSTRPSHRASGRGNVRVLRQLTLRGLVEKQRHPQNPEVRNAARASEI